MYEDEEGRTPKPRSCSHRPPRSTVGALGMLERCKCGAVVFVLRYAGDAPKAKRWDVWQR